MEDRAFELETSTHNSEKAQVLQSLSYDLDGDQDSIRVFNGVENFEFRLFSKYVCGDVMYPKAKKQVRVSQLDHDDEVHVYFAAAAKDFDSQSSIEENNHFAIIYNLYFRQVQFLKLQDVQKVIKDDELVTFNVQEVV